MALLLSESRAIRKLASKKSQSRTRRRLGMRCGEPDQAMNESNAVYGSYRVLVELGSEWHGR